MRKYAFIIGGICLAVGLGYRTDFRSAHASGSGPGKDTTEVIQALKTARESRLRKDFIGAKNFAMNALSLSEKSGWQTGRALAHLELGNTFADQGKTGEAYDQFILSKNQWTDESRKKEQLALRRQLGILYQQFNLHDKAAAELEEANKFTSDESEKLANNELRAMSLVQIGKTDEAAELYRQAQRSSDGDISLRATDALSVLFLKKEKYSDALPYTEQLVQKTSGNLKFQNLYVQALNRLGFISLKTGKKNKALDYYLQALEAGRKIGDQTAVQSLLNLGYLQTLTQDYPGALSSFSTARKLAKDKNDPVSEARSLNHLATTYLVTNSQAETGIELATEAERILSGRPDGQDDLADTYMILSELYTRTNNFEEAQRYDKKHQQIKTLKQEQADKQRQQLAQSRIEIERKESELKLALADEEKKSLEVNRNRLEAEKREKELLLKQRELEVLKERQALQESNLANQNLEKQRIAQQLLLAEQKITADKKNREILELQKNKEIQALALEQKTLKEQEQEKELKLAAANNKLQEQKIEDEKKQRQWFLYGLGALGLFTALIGYSFIQKRKDNKLLAKQKQEIEANLQLLAAANRDVQEKNEELEANQEELRQNSEELQATNDNLMNTQRNLEKSLEELKKTQESLVQSEKLASLGQLVAGISHEINTPIGVAFTAVTYSKEAGEQFKAFLQSGERMKKSDLDDFLENTLESNSIIFDNLQRAAGLIASFKKVSVEQTKDERNTFNVHDYIQDVLNSLAPELRKNNVKASIRGGENLILDSFPSAFSQVCINFVMNSIKHGFDGVDRNKEICFDIEEIDDKLVKINYWDNGRGIPENVLPKIFDPFFTTKRNEGGSGLGLNIVYNIISQKLNGNVTVTSVLNEKTTFALILPKIA